MSGRPVTLHLGVSVYDPEYLVRYKAVKRYGAIVVHKPFSHATETMIRDLFARQKSFRLVVVDNRTTLV